MRKGIAVLAAIGLVLTAGCATQQKGGQQGQGQQGQNNTQQVRNQDNRMGMERVREGGENVRQQTGQQMRVADKVADSVTRLDSIDSATVMVTDGNAYVGVVMDKDYDGELTSTIKNRVSKRVRKADNSIDQVFVSANPDFVSQLQDYAQDIQSGRPVSGLMKQFTDLVERTFPAAR
ncbi:MAG: YhcN/YlaJ family sporulation lipoprotein [Firmicutes bacterium]|nr:YhcN/YlaJ family sporulation lipoprotein [Bacillota bacterium]